MFNQYFGNYLLKKNVLTSEQLEEIYTLQKSVHVKIGDIAVNIGLLSPSQVREIHELQKNKDKRFGEIAIELDYLTDEQVESLLMTQRQGNLQFEETIVNNKYLTLAQLEKALSQFKKDNQLSDKELNILKQGNIDNIVRTLINFNASTYNEAFYKYTILLIKNIIRFLNEKPYIKKEKHPTKHLAKYLVKQQIKGKYRIHTGIEADENIFINLATNYAQEKLTKLDEFTKDSLREFLNVNNGIFLMNLSKQNIELHMTPPQFHQKKHIKKSHTYIIPIYLKKGEIHLIISSRNFLPYNLFSK